MDPSLEPDTVTEAVAFLREQGYEDDLTLGDDRLSCEAGSEALDSAVVTHQFRFEGPSDPGDEAIVLGVSCPTIGRRGIVVAGFGAAMEPESVELLHRLIGR